MKPRFFFSLIAAFALSLVTTFAWAGPATDYVKAKQTELFKLLEKNDADSKKKVTAIFDEIIDYQSLAEASLGPEWKNLKAEQQKEFVGLMKQLVANAYEKNGERDRAVQELKRALDENSAFAERDAAEKLLKDLQAG